MKSTFLISALLYAGQIGAQEAAQDPCEQAAKPFFEDAQKAILEAVCTGVADTPRAKMDGWSYMMTLDSCRQTIRAAALLADQQASIASALAVRKASK